MRRVLVHFLFALLALLMVAAHPDQAARAQAAFDAGLVDYAEGEPLQDEFALACEPLIEARNILDTMQPQPYAHLSKRLGGVSPSSGLGDELGWGHDGPLSTAFRLLPRFLASLNPLSLVSKIPNPNPRRKVGRQTRERAERLMALIKEAEEAGCPEALALRADIRMFPPKGVRQDLHEAFAYYKRFLEQDSDPRSQFMVGFFYATGLGGAQRNQAKATLYYTFSALQGFKPAQMAMGYRYWTGISVKEDCHLALDYYESAAKNAYSAFDAGPPGGQTLLLTRTRLSDKYGGVYGPYASWVSTGTNRHRMTIKALKAAATGESEIELLQYYQYHADRDSPSAPVILGKFFYLGSVRPHPFGISSGAEGVSEIPQNFLKAKTFFFRVARRLWPTDFDDKGNPAPKKRMSKEALDSIVDPAKVAASFLGRMALRGEGMPQNYNLARLWFERAASLGEREAHNGLGIIYRDGLGVTVNREKALGYFDKAARFELPEAQVNIAKMCIENNEVANGVRYLEAAQRLGSPFEAFHLLATMYATAARNPNLPPSGGECGVAVSYFKLVSELGAWEDDYLGDADRAWGRGEEDKALLGWWIAAEMGYEAGQNNVAFLLSRGVTLSANLSDDTPLSLWTRSAAQGNADAMVMVGDHYYRGEVPSSETNGSAGPDYTRAFAYYQTAAYKASSMAYWNLGYMYENGQGVPQDWHLAKRNYDSSLEASWEAYLPWMLSLTKLYLRSWWTDLRTNGAVPGLSLFEDEVDGPGYWEAIKRLFLGPEEQAEGEPDDGYEDYSGAGWGAGDDQDGANALEEFDDDLLETLVMLALTGLIMGLVWLRGRWVRQAQQQPQQ